MKSASKRPATLWSQHVPVHQRMWDLTVGNDRETDGRLLTWDILGSLGHIEGLRASKLLTAAEHATLRDGLRHALDAATEGRFRIDERHEDAHSAVEEWLTSRVGSTGAKLPTGRSRNDQIACDLLLWLKQALLDLDAAATELVKALLTLARRNAPVSFPGYTHTRKAMPSSIGLWAAGHAAGLIETLEALPALWASVDRCPLGSAAGYGVPLSLDRDAVARALGFAEVATPVTTVQNGRGKLEAAALFWCAQLGHDAAKAASDVILFSAEEYGYLILDASLATGSSLMPHKRNPDLFELTRARAAAVEGDLATVLALRGKLASGYHRDFQMLKEPLLRGMSRAAEMLEMLRIGIEGVKPDRERCAAALEGGVLATGSALAMAARGVPFREAYRTVSDVLAKGTSGGAMSGTHNPASAQQLGLGNLRNRIAATSRFTRREERRFANAMERLAGRSRRSARV